MKVGELLKVTRDDIQDFPGDTIQLIMDLQKEGWRAQRSNRSHVMLLAPDGVTKYSASRNANSAKYLSQDIAKYKRGETMHGEPENIEEVKVQHEKFPCPHTDCPKQFVSQEKLNVHVAVDHEGYLKCPDCDEVRANNRALSQHRSRKHGYVSPRYKRRKELEADKVKALNEVLEVSTSKEGPEFVLREMRDPSEIYRQTRAQLAPDVDPEVVRTEDIEFIDSRDSWVLNHHNIIDRRIGTLEQILDAIGLRMEIRVWKPSKD